MYNEKYFQKVSFCVVTHPVGQNGRAVCRKHGNHGDAHPHDGCGPAGHQLHNIIQWNLSKAVTIGPNICGCNMQNIGDVACRRSEA